MAKRWSDLASGRNLPLSDSMLTKWLAVTILLSIYRIPTSKLFKNKFFQICRNHGISERTYRSIWSVFRTEDLKAEVGEDGTITVELAEYVKETPYTGKYIQKKILLIFILYFLSFFFFSFVFLCNCILYLHGLCLRTTYAYASR